MYHKLKAVGFYLLQLYQIMENAKWWRSKFIQWRNITKAMSWFFGRYKDYRYMIGEIIKQLLIGAALSPFYSVELAPSSRATPIMRSTLWW